LSATNLLQQFFGGFSQNCSILAARVGSFLKFLFLHGESPQLL